MQDIEVDKKKFKKNLYDKLKISKVYNYYGMIEQTGSIFTECEKCSCFVTSIFSEVLVRDKNFKIVKDGKRGLIQLLSVLPTSYPGHNILTEDIGEIISDKKCDCSKKGTRFLVHGRVEEAEIRGCSDI